MYAKRIIPCLDVKDGRVVKGMSFVNLRDAGDPVEAAAAYDRQGADELVLLDIVASHQARGTMLDIVARVAQQIFIPFTVGGGIRTAEDFNALLRAGADKVSVNSAALKNPELLTEAASRFGSQITGPSSPSPDTLRLIDASFCLSIAPIIEVAHKSLPSAAVALLERDVYKRQEITLSAISGNLIPKAANKIPATDPIISGFVTIPLSIFVIFILSPLNTASVITARILYIRTITVTSIDVIPSLPLPKILPTIGKPISTKLLL